jgi:Fe2+ transport system protein FeoA
MMTKVMPNSYPLTLARENQRVRVVDVAGGKHLSRRLRAIGIGDNANLIVVRRHSGLGGGMVVRCGESRWALGTGMAHKILVTDSETPLGN